MLSPSLDFALKGANAERFAAELSDLILMNVARVHGATPRRGRSTRRVLPARSQWHAETAGAFFVMRS
jgi:hypothetical protein